MAADANALGDAIKAAFDAQTMPLDRTAMFRAMAAAIVGANPGGLIVPAAMADPGSNTRVSGTGGGTKAWQLSSATMVTFPLPVRVGDKVDGYTVYLAKSSNATKTITARLYTTDAGGTETARGTGKTNAANNPGNITLAESGLAIAITTGMQAYVAVDGQSGNDLVFSTVGS